MGNPAEPLPVDVIIPALNEAAAIGQVVRNLRRQRVRSVYVVDNGSDDGTADIARRAGAIVVREARKGYGAACLAGLRALPADTGIVVFVDGDGSDDLTALDRLVDPIGAGETDLVVGARVHTLAERGSLGVAQRVGNLIACAWLRQRFGLQATDLGPFRAIRMCSLARLGMRDRGYGWTVEMQIKAARARLRYREVPVRYRRRVGRSKISGTVRGALAAGATILSLLARYDLLARLSR
jgi:glycosyltransferase involved in cell wall biosynthesis